MNKQDILKMFDENCSYEWMSLWEQTNYIHIKKFVFNTIIPDVLNNLLVDTENIFSAAEHHNKMLNEHIKKRAKKLYDIDL